MGGSRRRQGRRRATSEKENEEVILSDFISVKGEKAQGNQLSRDAIRKVNILESLFIAEESTEGELEMQKTDENNDTPKNNEDDSDGQITLGLD